MSSPKSRSEAPSTVFSITWWSPATDRCPVGSGIPCCAPSICLCPTRDEGYFEHDARLCSSCAPVLQTCKPFRESLGSDYGSGGKARVCLSRARHRLQRVNLAHFRPQFT